MICEGIVTTRREICSLRHIRSLNFGDIRDVVTLQSCDITEVRVTAI